MSRKRTPQVRAEQPPASHFPQPVRAPKGACGGSEEGEAARVEGQQVTSWREGKGVPSPWTLLPTDLSS